MAAKGKNFVEGRDDAKVFLLKCPDCRESLLVTRSEIGPMDKIRGILHTKRYWWIAVCATCGRGWTHMPDGDSAPDEHGVPRDAIPSMWVLRDIVEG